MSLSQTIRQRSRTALRTLGIEVSRSANPFLKLLSTYQIDVILDVGANAGQFGTWVRRLGYTGRIVSFEPIASAYRGLATACRKRRPLGYDQSFGSGR